MVNYLKKALICRPEPCKPKHQHTALRKNKCLPGFHNILPQQVQPVAAFSGKRIRTNQSARCAARVFRFVLIMP